MTLGVKKRTHEVMVRVHTIINDVYVAGGGAERLALQLHTRLPAHGFECRLLSLRDTAADCSRLPNMRSLQLDSPYSARAIRGIARYLREEVGPQDLVHVHLFPANLFVSLASRAVRSRATLVTTEHSTNNRRRGVAWGRALDALTYSRYERVFGISAATRAELATWQPWLAGRTEVIENGVELLFQEFSPSGGTQPFRVLTVGRLSPAKNIAAGLRAIAKLPDLPLQYRIAGVGPEEAKLRRLAHDLGISERVSFLGWVPDLADELKQADVCLLPSKWEGFGLAAVEAMNAGLPVVAGNVPGLRDVVGAGEEAGGILVDPLDHLAIAKELRGLLSNRERRVMLGQRGFERARRYGLGDMISRYAAAYRRLLHGGKVAS